jgi:hypothetical protein
MIASAHPYDESGLLRLLFYPMKHDISTATREMPVLTEWFRGGIFEEDGLSTHLIVICICTHHEL